MFKVFSFLRSLISTILSFVYDTIVSRPVTNYTYSRFLDRLKSQGLDKLQNLIDVGVGTGTALNQIISEIPEKVQVLGVDIDQNYVEYCQKMFSKRKNVEIELKNFLEMDENKNLQKFDVVVFSSSFMLMGEKDRALQIAKKILKKIGKIYFILTLFERKKKLVEKFKPLLKYALTIDFGQALTEQEFLDILKRNDVKVSYMERITRKMVPCFKVFRYFLVEGEI